MGRMRVIAVAIAVCASSSCGGEEPERRAAPVATGDPAVAFAPLVRLHPRERLLPIGADRFIANAGLEWGGGPCRFEIDVAASEASQRAAGERVPPLSVRRLGREPGYEVTAKREDCITSRGRSYSTIQRTRAFDRDDRPPGLYVDEGFGLDILTDAQPGDRSRVRHGSLAAVPVYAASELATVDGRPGLRIGYWMLYGRGDVTRPEPGEQDYHEGDWERVEVLLRRGGGPGSHRLVTVRYRIGERWLSLPAQRVELAGPGRRHPVVYAERGTHTPRLEAEWRRWIDWRTWERLRDVRRESWFGYGGGWGAIGDTAATSGPLGPSPFDVGPAPELDTAIGMP